MASKNSIRPQPHIVLQPPPWEVAPSALPYELERAPDAKICGRCQRLDRRQDREIASARVALVELDGLLGRMQKEVARAERLRERGQRERAAFAEEASTLRALLKEYESLASETDAALVVGSRRLQVARSRLKRARRELKVAHAATTGEGDGRLGELQGALASARLEAEKWASYAAALESRLRDVGEAVESD